MKTLTISDNSLYINVSNKQFKRILFLLNQLHNREFIETIVLNLNKTDAFNFLDKSKLKDR